MSTQRNAVPAACQSMWRSLRALAYAAALFAGLGAPAYAQEDNCVRRNLLDVAEERQPGARARLLAGADAFENTGSVLFRIDLQGREPSYLFGTVHVADEKLQALPLQVASALDAAKVVALERGDVSEDAVRSVMPLAARLMVQPPDRALDGVLSDDEMEIVKLAVGASGLAAETARMFRPWAATLFLASSTCEKARFQAGLKPLDMLVMERARSRGVQIVGLEKILEQYEALAAVPEELQTIWLKSSIALMPHIDDMSETTVALYQSRQINAVWGLTVDLTGDTGMTTEVAARLRHAIVDARNKRMYGRIRELLNAGGAFIAVGVMHLSGSEGIIALIEGDGLKITPIL